MNMMKPLWFVLVCCFVCVCQGDTEIDPPPSRELNVTQLDHYINTEEGREILEAEFASIKGGQRKPWTVAEREENIGKNRYLDLLAYDETRVHLPYDESESDYINANYINGFNRDKEYVATQGPLANTTGDFWAMVWHLKIKKIVMLANLVEHGNSKVWKYWPEVGGMYGDILVTRVAEVPFPKYQHVMRIFIIKKAGIPRVVRQFHFVGWPDLGVPRDTHSVVALLDQARNGYAPWDTAPLLIHCSAGIGRTGTVILFDSMKEKAKKDRGMVDFPKRLDSMRLQRVDVVEKKEQYVFAHRAVYDAFLSSETAALVEEVSEAYRDAEHLLFEGIALAAKEEEEPDSGIESD